MVGHALDHSLKDGTSVTIREMAPGDEGRSLRFFQSLPRRERQYLRMDVTRPENIRSRMNPGPFKKCTRLVAEKDGQFLADATICQNVKGWRRHVAEIRCIIHPEWQQKGLGKRLIFELFQRILQEKTEMIVCEVLPTQEAAIKVLEKLGFRRSMVRSGHVKDLNGERQDLYIYTLDVGRLWDTLSHYFEMVDYDYPRV